MHTVELGTLSTQVSENLAGRTGGGVSLAIGMAHIFGRLPRMDKLVGYWYHYAIMFEALFILTTLDAGTRVARYVLQELMGKAYGPLGKTTWIPGMVFTTILVVSSWGYLIYTGSISTIWPLFGVGNQLLATIALSVTTTFLVNSGKARYAWATAVPMAFVGVTTLTAAVLSISTIFWPMAHKTGSELQGYLDFALMSLFVLGVILVVSAALRRCWATLHGVPIPATAVDAGKPDGNNVEIGCC